MNLFLCALNVVFAAVVTLGPPENFNPWLTGLNWFAGGATGGFWLAQIIIKENA